MVELKQSIHLTINGQDIELTTADARELYALLGAAIGNAPAPTPVHAPLKVPYPGWEFPMFPTCHSSYTSGSIVSSHGFKSKFDTTLPGSGSGIEMLTNKREAPPGYHWSPSEDKLIPFLPMRRGDGTSEDVPPPPYGWKRENPLDQLSPLVVDTEVARPA